MRVLVVTNMYPPHHYGGYEINCQGRPYSFCRAGGTTFSCSRRTLRWREWLLSPNAAARSGCAPRTPAVLGRSSHRAGIVARLLRDRAPPISGRLTEPSRIIGPTSSPCGTWVPSRWDCSRLLPATRDPRPRRQRRLARVRHGGRRLGAAMATGRPTRRARRTHSRGAVPRPGPGQRRNVLLRQRTHPKRGRTAQRLDLSRCDRRVLRVNPHDFPVGGASPRPSWSWRLLHVGRIDDRKGIDIAVRALTHLPEEATLDIVGRGDDRSVAGELGALVARLGLEDRARFDVVERAQLAARYASADAVLFPPRWQEPFGLVPLEAMACSTPVISTGTGGSAEFLIDGANCLRVAVDDEIGLANAVQRLANDPALRARLVRGGLLTARELSLPESDDRNAPGDRLVDGGTAGDGLVPPAGRRLRRR